jgi:predicted SAM-dependent methyltransferase
MLSFNDIKKNDKIYLYAGDLKQWNTITLEERFRLTKKNWIGLTLPIYGNGKGSYDNNHIYCDITKPIPLQDNCVDIFQSEDVHEHIEEEYLLNSINEIYRILKPNGLFRLSLPDYNCDILYDRTEKYINGELKFDKAGGGFFDISRNKVMGNGHVWFPTYDKVNTLLNSSNFKNITYLHYYTNKKNFYLNKIDHSLGFVKRTPDFDIRVKNPDRPMSLVVDCYK